MDEFWAQHNPVSPAYSTQYRSAVFYSTQDQRIKAKNLKSNIEKQRGYPLYTAVEPIGEFYLAEDYHQKYYLQRDNEMMEALLDIFPDRASLFRSTLAARLNAVYSGDAGLKEVQRVFITKNLSSDLRDKIETLIRHG